MSRITRSLVSRSRTTSSTLLLTSLLAAGCYETGLVETDTGALAANEDGQASSNVGSLDAPRGRLELDGFSLYWKQHSTWEQGACVELRLRNTGCPVYNWEMALLLDQNLTYWADEGGAYFWPEDNLVLIEPEGSGSLSSNESQVFYFCAEPAVQVLDFDFRSLVNDCGGSSEGSGSGSSGSGTDSGDDGSSGSGSGASGFAYDRDMRVNYDFTSRRSDGLYCYDVSFTNTGDATSAYTSVSLFMYESVTFAELGDSETGTVAVSGDTLTYTLDAEQSLPAGATSGDVEMCWTPDSGVRDVDFANP